MEPEADDSDAEDEGSDYTTKSDGDRFVVDTVRRIAEICNCSTQLTFSLSQDFEGGSSTFDERSGTSGAGTFLSSTSGSAGGVRLNSTNPSASSSTAGTSTARQSGSTTGVASEARRVTPSVTDIPARGTQWAKPPKAVSFRRRFLLKMNFTDTSCSRLRRRSPRTTRTIWRLRTATPMTMTRFFDSSRVLQSRHSRAITQGRTGGGSVAKTALAPDLASHHVAKPTLQHHTGNREEEKSREHGSSHTDERQSPAQFRRTAV